ncbi:hypothetical protein B0H11DRAFT_2189097 [Mycena galericulata]|nr:hypothetical protein B0H11DRAFT_2189097 [Mycena galericulata]
MSRNLVPSGETLLRRIITTQPPSPVISACFSPRSPHRGEDMECSDSTASDHARHWRDLQRQRLAQINTTIAELGSEFESDVPEVLDNERRELEATLSSFSYPVHDAPVEIIRHILIHCLPSDGRVQPRPHLAPLLLVQICQRWREIAVSTFQLWSSLDFTFHGKRSRPHGFAQWDGPEEHQYESAHNLLETWFSRANGYPLSLTLRCSENRADIPRALNTVISKYSARWRRLEISFPRAYRRRRIVGPFPLLSSLSLNGYPLLEPGDLQGFTDTPQLRDVRLLGIFSLSNVPIGAAALTSLEIERSVSITECTAIFQRFPTLVHLKVSINRQFQTFVLEPIQIPPALESLHLDYLPLLDALTLPRLRRLGFTRAIYDHADITSLLAFISRSGCVINDLTLHVADIEDFALVEFFGTVPSIEVLHLNYRPSRTPRTIYGHLESTTLLPLLRTLSISEPVPTGSYRYDPLVKMLQARGRARRGGAQCIRLASFDLTLSDTIDERRVLPQSIHAEKIGRLIKGGLHFHVHGGRFEWPFLSSPDDELEFPAYHPSDRTPNAV